MNYLCLKDLLAQTKNHVLSIQVVNEYAWHNLFAHQLFIRPTEEELAISRSTISQLFLLQLLKQIQQLMEQILKHSLLFHWKNELF